MTKTTPKTQKRNNAQKTKKAAVKAPLKETPADLTLDGLKKVVSKRSGHLDIEGYGRVYYRPMNLQAVSEVGDDRSMVSSLIINCLADAGGQPFFDIRSMTPEEIDQIYHEVDDLPADFTSPLYPILLEINGMSALAESGLEKNSDATP